MKNKQEHILQKYCSDSFLKLLFVVKSPSEKREDINNYVELIDFEINCVGKIQFGNEKNITIQQFKLKKKNSLSVPREVSIKIPKR